MRGGKSYETSLARLGCRGTFPEPGSTPEICALNFHTSFEKWSKQEGDMTQLNFSSGEIRKKANMRYILYYIYIWFLATIYVRKLYVFFNFSEAGDNGHKKHELYVNNQTSGVAVTLQPPKRCSKHGGSQPSRIGPPLPTRSPCRHLPSPTRFPSTSMRSTTCRCQSQVLRHITRYQCQYQ